MNRWALRGSLLVCVAARVGGVDRRRTAALTPARRGRRQLRGRRYGAHLGYNFDPDDMLLGAQLSLADLAGPRVSIRTFDYYFVNGGIALGAELRLEVAAAHAQSRRGMSAGGLNWCTRSAGGNSGSDTNLNLATGLEGAARQRPGRMSRAGSSSAMQTSFQLVGGVSWR